MSIGDPNKSHWGGSGGLKLFHNKSSLSPWEWLAHSLRNALIELPQIEVKAIRSTDVGVETFSFTLKIKREARVGYLMDHFYRQYLMPKNDD